MKIFKKSIINMLGLVMLVAATTSCSDDDTSALQELNIPSLSNTEVTVSGLTFKWDKVDNATQYAYELRDSEGNLVKGNVTADTAVTFSGLKDNSTYTLNVWAYAKVGSDKYTRSKIATLTGTTHAIVKLANPTPGAEVNGNTVTIAWEAIANATVYKYSYKSENGTEGSGSTSDLSVQLKTLPLGTYTFSIVADNPDEAYAPSDTCYCTFQRSRMEIWHCNGTYSSAERGSSWNATIVAYDDNTYAIKNWFGVEGYDLEFALNGTEIMVTNAYYTNYGYDYVHTGIDDFPYSALYTASGYSEFSGNASSGYVWFYSEYNYGSGGYDQFTWEKSSPTIDDLVGDYSACAKGSYYGTSDWETLDYTHDVSITKVDDTTIKLNNLYWTGYSLVGTVDIANKTITFAAQEWGYYTFAGDAGATTSVTATFDDNLNITMDGWNAWYSGYYYLYGITCAITKK